MATRYSANLLLLKMSPSSPLTKVDTENRHTYITMYAMPADEWLSCENAYFPVQSTIRSSKHSLCWILICPSLSFTNLWANCSAARVQTLKHI